MYSLLAFWLGGAGSAGAVSATADTAVVVVDTGTGAISLVATFSETGEVTDTGTGVLIGLALVATPVEAGTVTDTATGALPVSVTLYDVFGGTTTLDLTEGDSATADVIRRWMGGWVIYTRAGDAPGIFQFSHIERAESGSGIIGVTYNEGGGQTKVNPL